MVDCLLILFTIDKMNGKDPAQEEFVTDVTTLPVSPYTEGRKASIENAQLLHDNKVKLAANKKKKSAGKSFGDFFYNPQRKTLLGRSSLNWGKNKFKFIFIYIFILAKLAAFYTVFYFSLGCFFVGLLYIFALLLDREVPRYYNTESAMAVRTTATVGLLKIKFRF